MILQAAHAPEVADLQAKQELELYEAQNNYGKQLAPIADLKKELSQLKHELAFKHSSDNEPEQVSTSTWIRLRYRYV